MEDYYVEVVTAINPDTDEEGEVGGGDGGIEVVADLRGLSGEALSLGESKIGNSDLQQGRSH